MRLIVDLIRCGRQVGLCTLELDNQHVSAINSAKDNDRLTIRIFGGVSAILTQDKSSRGEFGESFERSR